MDWNWNAIVEACRLDMALEACRGVSTLHWIAAACIASGVTLIVTALVIQQRQRRGKQRVVSAPVAAKPAPAAAATVVPTDVGYAIEPQVAEPTVPADVNHWADRLAAAADQLATLRSEMLVEGEVSTGTVLKETPSHVEYVFRTGEA